MTMFINLAGAEFGHIGGPHDAAPIILPDGRKLDGYHYPSRGDLEAYKALGITGFRLPFLWERMQATLGGPLVAAEIGLLKRVLADAQVLGLLVLPSMHNYGRYNGQAIGSDGGPTAAQLGDVWAKLAAAIKSFPNLFGYGLMNEPHDMGGANVWRDAAQATIDAIRTVDPDHELYICGDNWSGAHSWLDSNSNLATLRDPAGTDADPFRKIVFEAHQYSDWNSSGTYQRGYDAASPDVAVQRLQPFLTFLRNNKARGIIGELGAPIHRDARWGEVQKRMYDYMASIGLDGFLWAGGTWWWDQYELFTGYPQDPNVNLQLAQKYFGGAGQAPVTPVPPPPIEPTTPPPTTTAPPAPTPASSPPTAQRRIVISVTAEGRVRVPAGRWNHGPVVKQVAEVRFAGAAIAAGEIKAEFVDLDVPLEHRGKALSGRTIGYDAASRSGWADSENQVTVPAVAPQREPTPDPVPQPEPDEPAPPTGPDFRASQLALMESVVTMATSGMSRPALNKALTQQRDSYKLG